MRAPSAPAAGTVPARGRQASMRPTCRTGHLRVRPVPPGPAVRSGQSPERLCLLGRRREELAGPDGQPELHPIEARPEVAAGELLDLAHPVAERVAVDEQLGRRRLPPRVVLQEGPERWDQVAALLVVV